MPSSLSVNSTVPQIPNLTVQLPRTMASANVKPLAHQPDVHTGHDLGELSAWFESARSAAGAIGYDLHGGWSYGTYQIASNTGTMAQFLDYLRTAQPQAYALLDAAGGSSGAMKGSKEFKKAWETLASDRSLRAGFAAAQYGFIKTQHFDVLAAKVYKDTGLDVGQRSVALQNVFWSVVTQHGENSSVIRNALRGKDVSKMTDRQIIEAIYAERGAVDINRHGVKVARYFPSSTPAVQAAVLDRLARELPMAIGMLSREISAAQ
jgi:hypothetical protein